MHIIKIEDAGSGRHLIYMEDGLTFPIGKKESRNLELEEGKELSEEQLSWILEELVFPRGRNYLICLLASRDYTVKEVNDKLTKACYPEAVREEILCYGLEKHYLDDSRYAEDYIRTHKDSKSIRQLKYQLSLKGISEEILDSIEVTDDMDELILKVQRYWEKKKGTPYEKNAKTYQYFVRKGYDSSSVRQALFYSK